MMTGSLAFKSPGFALFVINDGSGKEVVLHSYCRSSTSNVCRSVNPSRTSSKHVRCTCSIHGENEQNLPPVFYAIVIKYNDELIVHFTLMACLANFTASYGRGRSRNTTEHYLSLKIRRNITGVCYVGEAKTIAASIGVAGSHILTEAVLSKLFPGK